MMNLKATAGDSSKPVSGEDQYFDEVNTTIGKSLRTLEEMLYALEGKTEVNEPVAFATNALFALEFHQRSNPKYYESVLFPIIKSKADYLHSEGVASTLWALGQLEQVDESLVETIVDAAADKKFGSENTYLTHKQYNLDEFTPVKDNHFSERTASPEVKSLFYQDGIHVVELYDGVKNLLSKPLSSQLTDKLNTLKHNIEENHPSIRDTHSRYIASTVPVLEEAAE